MGAAMARVGVEGAEARAASPQAWPLENRVERLPGPQATRSVEPQRTQPPKRGSALPHDRPRLRRQALASGTRHLRHWQAAPRHVPPRALPPPRQPGPALHLALPLPHRAWRRARSSQSQPLEPESALRRPPVHQPLAVLPRPCQGSPEPPPSRSRRPQPALPHRQRRRASRARPAARHGAPPGVGEHSPAAPGLGVGRAGLRAWRSRSARGSAPRDGQPRRLPTPAAASSPGRGRRTAVSGPSRRRARRRRRSH